METLIINVDNEKNANDLMIQLNKISYIKTIVHTNHHDGVDHILSGQPLSDDILSNLMDEAELDTETLTMTDVQQKLNNKFKDVWSLSLGNGHI